MVSGRTATVSATRIPLSSSVNPSEISASTRGSNTWLVGWSCIRSSAYFGVSRLSRAHRRAAPRGFAGARADHTARSGRRRFALSRRSDSASQRSTCRFRAGRRRAARPNVERATRRARVRPDRSIHFSVDISTDIGSKNPQQSKLRAFAGTSEFVSSPPLDHCPTSQQPQHRPCRGTQTNAVLHSFQKITCAPESSDAVVCDSACDAVSESSRFISRVRSLMYSLVRE